MNNRAIATDARRKPVDDRHTPAASSLLHRLAAFQSAAKDDLQYRSSYANTCMM